MKRCTLCQQEKSDAEFYRHGTTGRMQSRCKACTKSVARQWQKDHPERYAYLIAKNEAERKGQAPPIEASYAAAKGTDACAICGAKQRLHHDHSHATGNYRGVVCRSCNLRLAEIERSMHWYIAALNYLWAAGDRPGTISPTSR